MFKGMFKRGKNKNKQDQSSYGQSPVAQQQQPPPQSASGSQAAPPQLPPIQNASPLQSATDTSKPLPPTHPLSTGTQDRPQEAVPVNHDAQPGPPEPTVNIVNTSNDGGVATEQETTSAGEVSPLPGSTVDGARSEPVSALDNDSSPQPPPKTDSAVDTSKPEEQIGMQQNFHQTGSTLTKAVTDSQPAETANENVQPNGITSEDKPATEQGTTPDQPTTNAQTEEKVPVTMEEPPPIKAVRAAPGMSATSGPLEDFPEGGDMRDD